MESKSILLYGTIIATLGVGGYLFWKSQNKKKSDSEPDVNDLLSQALGKPITKPEAGTPKPDSQISTPTTITTTTTSGGQVVQQTNVVSITPEQKLSLAKSIVDKYVKKADDDASSKCKSQCMGSTNFTCENTCISFKRSEFFLTYVPDINAGVLPLGFIFDKNLIGSKGYYGALKPLT